MAQHKKAPTRTYTVERITGKIFPWRTARTVKSDKYASDLIASFIPTINRQGETVSENQARFYDPKSDAWYLVTWDGE